MNQNYPKWFQPGSKMNQNGAQCRQPGSKLAPNLTPKSIKKRATLHVQRSTLHLREKGATKVPKPRIYKAKFDPKIHQKRRQQIMWKLRLQSWRFLCENVVNIAFKSCIDSVCFQRFCEGAIIEKSLFYCRITVFFKESVIPKTKTNH